MAGAIAVCVSFIAVILVLPMLGVMFIRNEETLAKDRTPADALMDGLGVMVGEIVDRVTHRPYLYSIIGVVLFFLFGAAFVDLPTRYRLADQVPDREQALDATSRIDQKLTGANPVHVMIEWTRRHAALLAQDARRHRAGAQRAREGGRPRQRVVDRKPQALAARGGR